MEIKTLTTLEELESLGSALTMEGLAEDSISEFIDWIKQYTPMKSETAYIIKGKTMNDVYMLLEIINIQMIARLFQLSLKIWKIVWL